MLRANVNNYTMIATLIDTKNGKDRDIALNSEIVSLLKKYPFGDKFFNVDYKTFHKEFDKANCMNHFFLLIQLFHLAR